MQTARVIQEHKTTYLLSGNDGELSAIVRGTFHMNGGFPKVGDYVRYTIGSDGSATIEEVLPRKTEIVRVAQARNKRGGDVKTEVLVANVDVLFIVMGLDQDFNVSRAERYASLAAQSGTAGVFVLNKCDVVPDVDYYAAQIRERLPNVPIHAVSATSGQGMEALAEYLDADTTAVLLGSSGAGKSTITNWLLQRNTQATQNVREEDSRGRHTTTSRQLFAVPGGGFLIDTPGVRELGVLGETEDVFASIEALAKECRFSDCDHEKSAGCAIQAAIKDGSVVSDQLANYLKLRREHQYIESKTDPESGHHYREKRRKQATQGTKLIHAKYKARGVK